MRVALFAPVQFGTRPEGREARRLARALARLVDLTVYVRRDPLRQAQRIDGLVLAPQDRFEADHRARPYDHVLYFLVDDAYTAGYVARALDTAEHNVPGGVVLLRDGTLNHHFQTDTLYQGNAQAFTEGMAHSHPALGERAGAAIAFGGGHEMLFRQHDLFRSYLETASMVLVAHRDLAERVERVEGQLAPLVRTIPRGVVPAEADPALVPDGAAPSRARHVAIRLGELLLDRRDAAEVARAIVGADDATHVVLVGAVAPPSGSTDHPRITWHSHAPTDRGPLPAFDAVVDLRDPTPGAVLGEILRWLSAGVALWIADHPAYAALPMDQPARVRLDEPVAPQILEGLSRELDRGAIDLARRRVRAEAMREARAIVDLLDSERRVIAERRVLIGRLWVALLEAKRRGVHRRIRDAVFIGLPVDLPDGLGAQFVSVIEDQLAAMGLGDWNGS